MSNDEICKFISELHACSEEVLCDLNPPLLGHALLEQFDKVKFSVAEASCINKNFIQYL